QSVTYSVTAHSELYPLPLHERSSDLAFAAQDPDEPNFTPSGILNGWEWDRLDKREKLRLVKYWHHFFVRTQDLIGNDGKVYEFGDRKSTRLNSSHVKISYAGFCLKKK